MHVPVSKKLINAAVFNARRDSRWSGGPLDVVWPWSGIVQSAL